MGGCITQPKRVKVKEQNPEPQIKKSRLKKTVELQSEVKTHQINSAASRGQKVKSTVPKEQKKRNKIMNSQEFVSQYRIEQNVGTTTRLEGPKFVSSLIDGSCRILRVINFGQYNKKRLEVYREVLDLQILEDQNGNLLVLQEYYCGPTLDQLLLQYQSQNNGDGNAQYKEDQAAAIKHFLIEIYKIIYNFHERGIVLGNLNLFSFRQVSDYDCNVGLTDINFQLNFDDFMGHANKEGEQADWESLGFIVQAILGNWPPIYLQHKIQYMDTGNQMINLLLKGRKIQMEELNQIKIEKFEKINRQVIAGYRLRRDINKLLKVRKRRMHHHVSYYSQQAFINQGNGKRTRISQDNSHRLQTNRILERISEYIEEVTTNSQQAFLNYNNGTDSLKKLKAVFLLKEKEKKLQELKDTLLLLK